MFPLLIEFTKTLFFCELEGKALLIAEEEKLPHDTVLVLSRREFDSLPHLPT